MDQSYSFRSALHGFNRLDVIEYIRHLMAENEKLRERVAVAENIQKEKTAQTDKLHSDLIASGTQLASVRKTLADTQAELETAYADLEAAKARCVELENGSVNTAQLGAAMVDARRFSDLLFDEAMNKANRIFQDTAQSAEHSGEQAADFAAQTATLRSRLFEMLVDVENSLADLGTQLTGFHRSVVDENDAFLGRFSEEMRRQFTAPDAGEADA